MCNDICLQAIANSPGTVSKSSSTYFIHVTFFTIFFPGLALGQQVESVTIDENIVERGDIVNIECKVTDWNLNVYVNWWKRQNGEVAQMGTNNAINALFADTGRYEKYFFLVKFKRRPIMRAWPYCWLFPESPQINLFLKLKK